MCMFRWMRGMLKISLKNTFGVVASYALNPENGKWPRLCFSSNGSIKLNTTEEFDHATNSWTSRQLCLFLLGCSDKRTLVYGNGTSEKPRLTTLLFPHDLFSYFQILRSIDVQENLNFFSYYGACLDFSLPLNR